MKKRATLALMLPALALFGVTSCNRTSAPEVVDDTAYSISLKSGEKTLFVGNQDKVVVTCMGSYEYEYSSSDPEVAVVDAEGKINPLKVGSTVISVKQKATGGEKSLSLEVKEAANGAFYYAEEDYDEKAEILGKLEGYAVDKHLAGLTLFENGRTVMYNPRIQKGAENYISGYGFGILSEGKITAPLAKEENAAWKNYLHSAQASDPGSINALDTDGSAIADLYSYISSAYWGTRMNATKDGYEFYPVLAKDMPVALNPSENGYATTWKFHVRTGEDGLKYSSASSKRAAFNGRGVALEDYLFGYKLLLNGKLGFYRGDEMAGDTGSSAIVGASSYYSKTKGVDISDKANIDKIFADNVMVVADPSDNSITITLAGPVNSFYAMYYLSSSLCQPVPADFIDAIGGAKNYGNFVEDTKETPVDTILSLSPYTLEYWESGKTITFKRNADWVEFADPASASRYAIEGVHIATVTAAKSDPDAVFNMFLDGQVDSCTIPQSHLQEYRNDPRTTTTKGDSTFKLNMNTCTKEEWIEKFGVNGTIDQTSEERYWDVKPWMSNDAFVRGIEASINRERFAANRGYVPSNDYFASSYMINPEEGVSYDSTEAHKAVLANHYPETYGYNLEASKSLFKYAVDELVAGGQLKKGTVENPTKISIDTWWMYESDIEDYGDEISSYIEAAFNDPSVSGGTVQLEVKNFAVADWIDVYYDHLMIGQFDLAFGSISGNKLDPLNFMEVLKSNNASGFTLNWGCDTSVVSESLVYNGQNWSFDALYDAADHGTVVKNGKSYFAGDFAVTEMTQDETTGAMTVKIDYAWEDYDNLEAILSDICLWVGATDYETFGAYYDEDPDASDIVIDEASHSLSFEVSAAVVSFSEGYLMYLMGQIKKADIATYEWQGFVSPDTFGAYWGLTAYYYQSIDGRCERYLSTSVSDARGAEENGTAARASFSAKTRLF